MGTSISHDNYVRWFVVDTEGRGSAMLASIKHWLRGVLDVLSKQVVIVYSGRECTVHTPAQ
jgi:hypothetical protein